jgi:gas vesicle protein
MKKSVLFFSILAGIAAGALAGVLLAPQKGKVTRRRIVQKGKDLIDDAEEKMEEVYHELVS